MIDLGLHVCLLIHGVLYRPGWEKSACQLQILLGRSAEEKTFTEYRHRLSSDASKHTLTVTETLYFLANCKSSMVYLLINKNIKKHQKQDSSI